MRIDRGVRGIRRARTFGGALAVFATSAAFKIEHYEIASYKSAIKLARKLGLSEIAQQLQASMFEEQRTAVELEQMAGVLGMETEPMSDLAGMSNGAQGPVFKAAPR